MTTDIIITSADLAPVGPSYALDVAIVGWLDAKHGKSQSDRTRASYAATLASYRTALLERGLDLDAPSNRARDLGLVAQEWAGLHAKGKAISPATYNQRLAVVSSFYQYAARRGLIPDGNPIASYVDRRGVDAYGSAAPLAHEHVTAKLGDIDRTTPLGQRDYALLSVAVTTGRRLSELAALRCRDMSIEGGTVTLVWRRTKGGKMMRDTLARSTSAALLTWLHSHYGADLEALASDAPLWVVLAPRGRGGALSGQSIADVCLRHLGTSKVHALRHTFAHTMTQAGASVGDVQRRLGHSNLATTDRYLKQLASAENPYADGLATLFGINEDRA